MISDEMLERYRSMTCEDKLAALDNVLDMDAPPLDMVVAFYVILKPDRAGAMAERLRRT